MQQGLQLRFVCKISTLAPKKYVEEVLQDTRALDAFEEAGAIAKQEDLQVSVDEEELENTEYASKMQLKKNQFYLRFDTNYLTPKDLFE